MRNNNPYEPTRKYPHETDGFERPDQPYQDNGRQNMPRFHQKKTPEENYYQQPRYQEDYDPDHRHQTDF